MSKDLAADVGGALMKATAGWKKEKLRSERVSSTRLNHMRYTSTRKTVRDAAFEAMEGAYNKASSNGKYYANARQIMYAARPYIIEKTGQNPPWTNSSYFTQKLLKDYLEDFDPAWKVVWDARGHFNEPHTGKTLGLGGIDVKKYIEGWHEDVEIYDHSVDEDLSTSGPVNRYGTVLFIEKEGFTEILADAGIAARYDIGIMSTKGMPNGASCRLANALHQKGITVFVLHDFDYDGFKITNTLRNGTRLAPATPVVDIGFRLEDVTGLESEAVTRKDGGSPKTRLEEWGATEEEAEFLVERQTYSHWYGSRVELNAMTSEQFIKWLDKKLKAVKIKKIVPDKTVLQQAYLRAVFLQKVEEAVTEIETKTHEEDIIIPEDLRKRVRAFLKDGKQLAWDDAVWSIASDDI